MKIVLVTKTGCGACVQFLRSNWPSLKDRLSYGIGGGVVEHIDITRDAVPPQIRRILEFVPQIFAVYSDGTLETPKNPVNSPAGIRELEQWVERGPPKYSSLPSDDESDGDIRLEVVAVTSSGCGVCALWESSGGLKKFLDDIPSGVDKSQYNISDTAGGRIKLSPEDERRRRTLSGIGVPSVIVVESNKWRHPVSQNLQRSDVMPSPAEVRSPAGLAIFRKWLAILQDKEIPLLGYLILATSSSCGHCRAWKQSGGMDEFLKTNSSIPGILLLHHESSGTPPIQKIPQAITSQIEAVPSVFFVPAASWSSDNPELIPGPYPQNTAAMATWIDELTGPDGHWKNEEEFVPQSYQVAATKKSQQASAFRRPPLSRQSFR